MRLKSAVVFSSSVAVLALIATPAAAQSGDPATPPDPTVEAQEQPADPDAGSPQTDDAVQTAAGQDQAAAADDQAIVVTGLRRSLRSARNIKRNSEQIVDAIVAEDIGKLPDITVSDTAARIPGIQVERAGGEASRVLLRGFDRDFYTTTYNGREIFTAETRSVALQDFPAGAIAAVEAFKTSTANLVEPGLAGLINVRSRRPFDFSGLEVAGSVWANRPNQSRDVKPNAQLLLSNRWETANGGEIGALINFSYTRLHYQDSIRRHGFFIAGLGGPGVPPGARTPDWPEIRYNEADRWRPSINGAVQWRPNSDLELYAEGLWQGFREESTDRMWAQPLWGGASYENIVMDGNQVISGTVNNPTACCGGLHTWGFQGATKRKTDTYQFAVGGRYDAGPLQVTADIARTDSKFDLRTESIDFEINTKDYSVDWFTGRPGGSGPTFQIRGLDFADPSIYDYRGFFEDYLTAEGDDWQARLDFQYEPTGIEFLRNIQWGARYVNRDAAATAGAFYWNLRERGISILDVPLDYQLFNPAFRGDNNKPEPTTWLAPTFDSLWDDLRGFRQFNIGLTGVGSVDGPPDDPTRTYNINERSLAGYGQVNFGFAAGDVDIDATLGMRVVRTRDHIEGVTFGFPVPVPFDEARSYTDWLPNANVNIRFSPQWQLRLAASETRTRPNFIQLRPGISFDSPPGCPATQPGCFRTGNSGNPNLENFESTNYDASLEYYFSPTGFASAAVFYRDINNFIANRSVAYDDPSTDYTLAITTPFNLGKGRIKGFEAQVRTFFDFASVPEWARSFGVEANVTYIDAKVRYSLLCGPDNPDCVIRPVLSPNATTQLLRVPDVSKWTWNLVGMYERGPLTLRLAYNRRSKYPEGALAERDNFYTLQGRGRPGARLDWSSSYAVNDNLTLFFDWTNILKKPFKADIVRVNYPAGVSTEAEIFPMLVRYEESVVSGGIRFRFGRPAAPRAAPAPAYVPPPPPPVVEPAPVAPPPPPPPPPADSGERG